MTAGSSAGESPAGSDELRLQEEPPTVEDVIALLARHLAFARGCTPPEDKHALDPEALQDPAVDFFTARREALQAASAPRRLGDRHVVDPELPERLAGRARDAAKPAGAQDGAVPPPVAGADHDLLHPVAVAVVEQGDAGP